MHTHVRLYLLLLGALSTISHGNTLSAQEQCLLDALRHAEAQTTVETLRLECTAAPTLINTEVTVASDKQTLALLPDKNTFERNRPNYTRYALLPYKPIYVLPFSYNKHPNQDPLKTGFSGQENLDHTEIKFQISMQVPLAIDLIGDNGDLMLGYTQVSWWQAYNNDISSPFRETNYEPELFIDFSNDFEWQGFTNSNIQFGFNHQSNGRGGDQSRSWNRLFTNVIIKKDNWLFSIKPWWRIPEDDKSYPGDPTGNDNPDIDDYMGYGDFLTLYREGNHTFSMLLRNNLRTSENKGAVQLDWSFPVSKRLRGHVQYFNGYGESLIDYNVSSDRFSIGFEFTDWLL